MAYTCSYCKTGVMNTGEQYLTHINGTKHKKKVFQLQAPDDGIEYNEFKRVKSFKAEAAYVENSQDFPSLSSNNNTKAITNGSTVLEYNNIKKKYNSKSRPIIVYENSRSSASSEIDEFVTIDDVFFKENSKTESAKYIVNSYIKNKKTAAQALNEIAKAMLWDIDFEQVSAKNFKYGVAVLLDGIEFTIGEGESKKEAKQNASAEAINEIKLKLKKNKDEPQLNEFDRREPEPKYKSQESVADAYQNITIDKMKELERATKRLFVMPKRYAAFIITERSDQQARDGTIVAFGAGKGVLHRYEDGSIYPGYHLRNFDALVLAKRSLQCFFYNQILLIFDKKKQKFKGEKVYFEIAKNGFLKFKPGCRLHLFLSHAPKGDCVESIPRNWEEPSKLSNKEMERDKNGHMDPIMYSSYSQLTPLKDPGHIRILKDTEDDDQWVSLVSHKSKGQYNRNMIMSPTDKLMAWIHLGIQGAMLSHLMNPIYLYSIQFGKDYMHEHISRALLCRVPLENLIDVRGPYYDNVKFHDPYLERVSQIHVDYYESESHESKRVCFNWYMNPVTDEAEVVDTRTGCVHPNSPFHLPGGEESNTCSRLSKVCMLVRLKESINAAIDYFAMRPEFQRTRFLQGINQAAKYNYNSFKSSATDYRQLKQCLFESLNTKRYGEWLPNVVRNEFNLMDYYDV